MERAEIGKKMGGVAEGRVIRLALEGEARIVGQQHRNLRARLRPDDLAADALQLFAHLLNFPITALHAAIVVQDSVPILFRAVAGRAPAEEENAIRAMRD